MVWKWLHFLAAMCRSFHEQDSLAQFDRLRGIKTLSHCLDYQLLQIYSKTLCTSIEINVLRYVLKDFLVNESLIVFFYQSIWSSLKRECSSYWKCEHCYRHDKRDCQENSQHISWWTDESLHTIIHNHYTLEYGRSPHFLYISSKSTQWRNDIKWLKLRI